MYLGIDLGTSGVKSLLIDLDQQVIASATSPLTVQRLHHGWSEQRAEDWIEATANTLTALKSSHQSAMAAVKGIGLSGQMHGATLIDAAGNPLRPCLLWNDTRATSEASTLDTADSRQLSGNIMFPGFTAPKVQWVKHNEADIFAKTKTILLPKDYIRWWLTGELVSDLSDASGTGWLNVGDRQWSDKLIDNAGIRRDQLPSLVEGSEASGQLRQQIASDYGLSKATIVAGGAGDNAASACGMGTISAGNAFLSLGTSGVLFAANASYLPNPASAVHTFCHAIPDTWHQMGVILSATDSLNWLAQITGKTPETLTNAAGAELQSPGQPIFLPYLSGERTPHNDAAIRGCFIGLDHSTNTAGMTRAVMEGVAFAFRDNLVALREAGTELHRVTAVGGGSRSSYWLQMLATILKIPVDTTVDGDFGAGFGAARLGLLAAESADASEICSSPPVTQTIEPNKALTAAFDSAYEQYRTAYPAIANLRRS